MDTDKQIEYWINTAADDLQTAELLINNLKILQGLFFCHLSIEKIIKAHIVKFTGETPPKSHNLLLLTSKTNINLEDSKKDFCGLLMTYQLEGRYPENYPEVPSPDQSREILTETISLFQWFRSKL
jgi:HEPN domain-containing protein